MSGLKELRVRIQTVQATRRITSAMKMIATAKLRRAQADAIQARDYRQTLGQTLADLLAQIDLADQDTPTARLLVGSQSKNTMLWVILATDRGLCGGFNSNLLRFFRRERQKQDYRQHQAILIGRKALQLFGKQPALTATERIESLLKPRPHYGHAQQVAARIWQAIETSRPDKVVLVYNQYVSALKQQPTLASLLPLALPTASEGIAFSTEPEPLSVISEQLKPMLTALIYQGMLDTFAGEQAARRVAMDNATRNANDMIEQLTLLYNRSRQAAITKELIEIIAGSESI